MKQFILLALLAIFASSQADSIEKELEILRKHQDILNKTSEAYRKDGYKAFADFIDHEYVDVDALKKQFDDLTKQNPTDPLEINSRKWGLTSIWFQVYLKSVNFRMFNNRTRFADMVKLQAIEDFLSFNKSDSEHDKGFDQLKDIVSEIIKKENNHENPDELYAQIFKISPHVSDFDQTIVDSIEAYALEKKNQLGAEKAEKYQKLVVLIKDFVKLLRELEPLDSEDKIDKLVVVSKQNNEVSKHIFDGEDSDYFTFMVEYIKNHKSNEF